MHSKIINSFYESYPHKKEFCDELHLPKMGFAILYLKLSSALQYSRKSRWKLNRAGCEFCAHHTAKPPVRLWASRLTSLNFSASVSPAQKCANNPFPIKFGEGEMIHWTLDALCVWHKISAYNLSVSLCRPFSCPWPTCITLLSENLLDYVKKSGEAIRPTRWTYVSRLCWIIAQPEGKNGRCDLRQLSNFWRIKKRSGGADVSGHKFCLNFPTRKKKMKSRNFKLEYKTPWQIFNGF